MTPTEPVTAMAATPRPSRLSRFRARNRAIRSWVGSLRGPSWLGEYMVQRVALGLTHDEARADVDDLRAIDGGLVSRILGVIFLPIVAPVFAVVLGTRSARRAVGWFLFGPEQR